LVFFRLDLINDLPSFDAGTFSGVFIFYFFIINQNSLKSRGCAPVHKNYAREIPNQKKKKRKKRVLKLEI